MFCAKIGGECPHRVFSDPNYVFVLMPFENSASIFDCIKRSVETLEKKKFHCERADARYTSLDIWCNKICQSIRRAKYLVVDTSGLNANVFYELGFAHALGRTKNIIITQNIEEVPFDVRGFSVIEYGVNDFPKLEKELRKALGDLEAESTREIAEHKSPEEMIKKLNDDLREEEKRAERFKKEVVESENRERELKKRIGELEAIKKNPEEETQKLIAEKEGEIARLEKELTFIDQKKTEEVKFLIERLADEQKRRQELEKELVTFKQTGDTEKLSQKASQTKEKDWATQLLEKGKELEDRGEWEEAINVFTKLIEKSPDHQNAYFNRAFCLFRLKDHERAIIDLDKYLEMNPNSASAYNNRGSAYIDLKDFERAIADFNKAFELSPKLWQAHSNMAEVLIMVEKISEAEQSAREVLDFAKSDADLAIGYYLLTLSLKLLGKDTDEVEFKLEQLCAKDFETTWSFVNIEDWLKEADVSEEVKGYIREKTEMLKKHQSE